MGYVQLSRLDLVSKDGFVIGVLVLLVLEELFWVRDCYCMSWGQSKARGEKRMEQQAQRGKCCPWCWR